MFFVFTPHPIICCIAERYSVLEDGSEWETSRESEPRVVVDDPWEGIDDVEWESDDVRG